jgi:hypothetical protein
MTCGEWGPLGFVTGIVVVVPPVPFAFVVE